MIRSLGFWSLLEPLQLQPRISSIVVEPITKIILGWNQADKGLKDALHFLLCLIIWKIIKHSKRKKSLAHPCSTYFVHDTTGLWVLEYLSTHSSSNLIMLGGEVNNEVPYEIRGLIFITHFFLIFGHDSSMTLDLLHYYMDFVMKKKSCWYNDPQNMILIHDINRHRALIIYLHFVIKDWNIYKNKVGKSIQNVNLIFFLLIDSRDFGELDSISQSVIICALPRCFMSFLVNRMCGSRMFQRQKSNQSRADDVCLHQYGDTCIEWKSK